MIKIIKGKSNIISDVHQKIIESPRMVKQNEFGII